jgi:hypothetical protein
LLRSEVESPSSTSVRDESIEARHRISRSTIRERFFSRERTVAMRRFSTPHRVCPQVRRTSLDNPANVPGVSGSWSGQPVESRGKALNDKVD